MSATPLNNKSGNLFIVCFECEQAYDATRDAAEAQGLCPKCLAGALATQRRADLAQHARRAVNALLELHGYGDDVIEEFVRELLHEHRTRQQIAAKFFIRFFEALAHRGTGLEHSDLRNQAAIELAVSIIKNVPEKLRHLPYT